MNWGSGTLIHPSHLLGPGTAGHTLLRRSGSVGFFSIFLFVQRHRIRAARHLPGFGADSLGSVQ